MNNDERIRKLFLQLSGVFYEIKEEFARKLTSAFKNESDTTLFNLFNKIPELEEKITFIKKTSENILEDLTSTLLKESIKIVTRHVESLNKSLELIVDDFKNRLEEEKNLFKKVLAEKNALIKKLLIKEPKFKILALAEEYSETDLKNMKAKSRMANEKLINLLKNLRRDGYIQLVKTGENLRIIFKNAPWNTELSMI